MSRLRGQDFNEPGERYAKDMPNTFKVMPKICQRYAKDVPKT